MTKKHTIKHSSQKSVVTYAIGYSDDMLGFGMLAPNPSLAEMMKVEPEEDFPAYILKFYGNGNNKILYKWNNGWEEYEN